MNSSHPIEQFQLQLLQLELELKTNLNTTDVLDRVALIETLETNHTRLRHVQRQFFGGECPDYPAVPDSIFRVLASVKGLAFLAGAGGGAAAAGVTVTTTTTGILFWKTTTEFSLAAFLAGTVGAPVILATGGLALVAGGAAMAGTHVALKKRLCRKVRTSVMKDYRERIVPSLIRWAEEQIAAQDSMIAQIDFSQHGLLRDAATPN